VRLIPPRAGAARSCVVRLSHRARWLTAHRDIPDDDLPGRNYVRETGEWLASLGEDLVPSYVGVLEIGPKEGHKHAHFIVQARLRAGNNTFTNFRTLLRQHLRIGPSPGIPGKVAVSYRAPGHRPPIPRATPTRSIVCSPAGVSCRSDPKRRR
jgi:hypothetical protein